MKRASVVKVDPRIMSGAPCFAGTRVPVRALIDYIEGGDSMDDFLDQYPTVSRKQVAACLEEFEDRIDLACLNRKRKGVLRYRSLKEYLVKRGRK